MTSRRTLIIIITSLAVIFALLAVYVFLIKDNRGDIVLDSFFGASDTPLETDINQVPEEASPFQRIISEVGDYALGDDKILALTLGGSMATFGIDGTVQNSQDFLSGEKVSSAQIAGSEDKAVVLTADGWLSINLTDSTLESLAPTLAGISFSPAGELALVEEKDGVSSVILRNKGASRTVYSSSVPDLTAEWVDNRTLALSTTPSGAAPGILYLLDTGTRRITRILGNRYGLSALVSPDKNWVLFSETDPQGQKIIMRILDVKKGTEKSLNIVTLPQKCAFSPQTAGVVYCASFRTETRTAFMPDDYEKGVLENRESDIIRVDLKTGEILTLYESVNFDPVNLKIDHDESFLYFVNKIDGALYRISL